jgi:hypothetical protein
MSFQDFAQNKAAICRAARIFIPKRLLDVGKVGVGGWGLGIGLFLPKWAAIPHSSAQQKYPKESLTE